VHVASLIFPLLVLLTAAGFAERRLFAAAVLVFVSFACSVARLLISDQQQVQAGRALEESNALLNSVFEGTGDALFIKDLRGRYLLVNRTFARLMNLEEKQVMGKSASELVDPEVAEQLAQQDRAVIEAGVGKSFEYVVPSSGLPRIFLTQKAPHRDVDGTSWAASAWSGTLPSTGKSKSIFDNRKKWKQSERWQVAWRMISTTC
jgi:PAS domain S-box-containing protein